MTVERPMFPPTTRRAFINTMAALPIAAAAPSVGASATSDAELVALGAQFEPLIDQYYAAHAVWSRSLAQASTEHDERFGTPAERNYLYKPEISAAWDETCRRHDVDSASERQSAVWDEMEPIADAINRLPVTSLAGLRAKFLVTFWEVAPLFAGNTEYQFEDASPFQHLFTAVAEVCGLQDKIASTGYQLPDIAVVDDGDDDADDDGEDA